MVLRRRGGHWRMPGSSARPSGLAARMSLVRLSTNPGPVGRVGTPEDVAQAFLAVMRNPFVTATVLHVDGGQRLV